MRRTIQAESTVGREKSQKKGVSEKNMRSCRLTHTHRRAQKGKVKRKKNIVNKIQFTFYVINKFSVYDSYWEIGEALCRIDGIKSLTSCT